MDCGIEAGAEAIELVEGRNREGAALAGLLPRDSVARHAGEASRSGSPSARVIDSCEETVERVSLSGSVQRLRPAVFLVATAAALGGLVFGYDVGGSGGSFVMVGFRSHFGWPLPIPPGGAEPGWVLAQMALINALLPLGGLLGAVPSGAMADALGRRPTIAISAAIFTVAAIMQAAAPSMAVLLLGRVVGGVGIGILSAIVPVYIAELAPEHFRGALSTLWQLAVTVGVLLAGALNIPLADWTDGWRLSYGANATFSAALTALMLISMPESPRWLAGKGRDAAAKEVLGRIRFPHEVGPELEEVQCKVREERAQGEGSWLDLLRSENSMRHRTLLGVSLQFFQQFSGINAIMFFAPAMLARFFSASGALYGTLTVNGLNHLGTYVALFAADRAGRVPLMVASGVIMTAAHMALAAVSAQPATPALGVAIVGLCSAFVVAFAFGWGPITWTLCAEIYPLALRGRAVSLATGTNWGAACAVGLLFPLLSSHRCLDLWGTFLLFSFCCAAGTLICQVCLPETAGASLEDVDKRFARHQFRLNRRFWLTLEE